MRGSILTLVLGLAGVGLIVLILAVSDPFGWHGRRLDKVRAAAEVGRQEAQLRLRERQSQQEVARLQARFQQQQKTISDLTDQAVDEAREQGDAKTALGDDRVRRLRQHDNRLCDHGTGMAGCASRTGFAAGDPAAVRPADDR